MPKTKVVLDEQKICEEYLNTRIGIEAIALKYHVGKLKIKQILTKNNIEFKKRGGQNNNDAFLVEDYHIKKYIIMKFLIKKQILNLLILIIMEVF